MHTPDPNASAPTSAKASAVAALVEYLQSNPRTLCVRVARLRVGGRWGHHGRWGWRWRWVVQRCLLRVACERAPRVAVVGVGASERRHAKLREARAEAAEMARAGAVVDWSPGRATVVGERAAAGLLRVLRSGTLNMRPRK